MTPETQRAEAAASTSSLRPGALATRLGPHRLRLAAEFIRFGMVGTVGFLVDSGVLMAAIALGLGPWLGRLLSFLAAATTTYALNRLWTFRHRAGEGGTGQWARFVAVNLGGFAANYGTYAAVITLVETAAAWPVLGVAAGSIAGLGVNFTLSRRFVFNAPTS